MASSWLRVAVVQFAPKIGEVHANIAKAHELCRGLTPRSVDLVCFPEMIFTGYMFPDAPSIAPHLEHPQTGPTASFCSELARRLQCVVVAGFPERLELPLSEPSASSTSSCSTPAPAPNTVSDSATHPLIGANAANLYGPTGYLLHTYHKSNLFPTDRTWACPGPGFTALDLPAPFGRTAVAICNDVNVTAGESWTSLERGPYELAGWCRREKVRVLVVLNAWLRAGDGGTEGVEEDARERGDEDGNADPGKRVPMTGAEDGENGKKPNRDVLSYWAMRLRPLWAKDVDHEVGTRSSGTLADTAPSDSDEQQNVVVIVCNRSGREGGKTFVGSSSMFVMRPGSGKPKLLHVMGEREEGVGVWTARIGSQVHS